MCAGRALGGALWAAIPAFLKTRFNVNEILTSLMLTYVATLLLSALVHGPWRDPDGYNFPESRLFPDAGTMPLILDGTRLHLGAILALVAVGAAWFMMSRTLLGFQVKVVGCRPARRALRRLQRDAHGLVLHAARRAAWPGSPASATSPGRSASWSRRSRRATASPRSSSPFSAGCILSACSWRGC